MRQALGFTLVIARCAAAAQLAEAPHVSPAMPPADWASLPELRFQRPLPPLAELSNFVRSEVESGRCAAAARSASSVVVRVEMAVLVTSDSRIRRIVPRAIDCVAVEQYATGLVSKLARDNIDNLGVEKDTWFRTALVFAWPV